MPKQNAADRRDRKRHRGKHGMRESNRSIKTVILPMIARRAIEAGAKHSVTLAPIDTENTLVRN